MIKDKSSPGDEERIRDLLQKLSQNIQAKQVVLAFVEARYLNPPLCQIVNWLTGLVITRVGFLKNQHFGHIFSTRTKCGHVRLELGNPVPTVLGNVACKGTDGILFE